MTARTKLAEGVTMTKARNSDEGVGRACVVLLALVAACRGEWQAEQPRALPQPGGAPVRPELGPLVRSAVAPPPISGGTLAVARDDSVAVAADPDRDRVWVVDLA